MKTSISLLLATVAACTLCSAFSLPIRREAPFAFTIWSRSSGLYMKMLENGLVEATGQLSGSTVEPTAQWIIRMTSDGAIQLENYLNRDHFLVLAKYNGMTSLLTAKLDHSNGQDTMKVHKDRLMLLSAATEAEVESTTASTGEAATATTQESAGTESTEEVESTIASTETEGSASGSGENAVTTAAEMAPTDTTTTVSTPTDVTASTEDNYVAVEYNWLQTGSVHRLYSSFKIKPAAGEKEDCFLAFSRNGRPASNLCDVSEDSDDIELLFRPVFYSSF